MHFAGGERVLYTHSQRFMNSPHHGFAAGTGGSVSGGGGAPPEVTVHSHVFLDGQQIFESVKTETARYAVRNGNPQQGRLAPGRL